MDLTTGEMNIENPELFNATKQKLGAAGGSLGAAELNRYHDLIAKELEIVYDSLQRFVTTETTDEPIIPWAPRSFELGLALMRIGLAPDQAMTRAARLGRAAWKAGATDLLSYLQQNNMTEDAQALMVMRGGRPEPT